jgi:hypothetical protein
MTLIRDAVGSMYLTPHIKRNRQHVACARLRGFTGVVRDFLFFGAFAISSNMNLLKRRIDMSEEKEKASEKDQEIKSPKPQCIKDGELSENDFEKVAGGGAGGRVHADDTPTE